MGDILHALPAITALRLAHPGWHIGWAVDPVWTPLLSSTFDSATARTPQQPLVDALHLVPAKRWSRQPFNVQTWREIGSIRRELLATNYDVALDLQGAVRSAVIARWSHAPRLLGEALPREPLARFFYREQIQAPAAHVVERAVQVATAIAGENLHAAKPLLPTDDAAEEWASKEVQNHPLVLINPGAGWGAKRWPAERYGEVARLLAKRGLYLRINCGPGEEPIAEAIEQASNGTAQRIQCNLNQFLAVTRRAILAIGGDTGPMHLASALGKPVVGIYGPTDPARNGPYGAPFIALRHPESKRDHSRRNAPEAGLLTITPEAVFQAAGKLLESHA
jgi:heptosyltransferase-1